MQNTMKKLRLRIALPLIGGVMVLAPATVFAQQGSDDGADKTSDSSSQRSEDRLSSKHNETENEANDDSATHEADDNDNDSLKNRAAQLLSEKRQKGKQHTAEQKQKACEARAANINKRADNYAVRAQRHLDVFNKIFTRVQAFQANKQLDVANYDALVATATAKQAAAQAAVDQVKALDVNIDCTQADPASTVATLKAATANARTALHEYRKSIKDIVVALKGASTTSDTKTGDDQ